MPGVYRSRLQVNSRQDELLVWVVKITGLRPSNATLTSLFRFAHVLDHRPFQYSLTCVFMRPKHPTRGKDNLHLLAFRLPWLGTIAAVRSEFMLQDARRFTNGTESYSFRTWEETKMPDNRQGSQGGGQQGGKQAPGRQEDQGGRQGQTGGQQGGQQGGKGGQHGGSQRGGQQKGR